MADTKLNSVWVILPKRRDGKSRFTNCTLANAPARYPPPSPTIPWSYHELIPGLDSKKYYHF